MEQQEMPIESGAQQERKPWVAANLSLLLAGLGLVYCGDIRRGLLHMWLVGTLLLLATAAVVLPIAGRGTVLLLLLAIWFGATVYSAFRAFQTARQTRRDYRLKDYNRLLCYAAFIFLFIIPVIGFQALLRANFIEVFLVPTSSMSPTIPAGSRLLVRKDSFRDRDPELNELVAFKNPENRRQTYVKRVIATAGKVVEIRDGVVLVDGEALDEASTVALDGANFPEFTVPQHHCFVLGDHRGLSKDSRHFGPVAHIALVGKVVFTR
ncbi:MAG: signal peptidase I [Verrucomicrobiales bacterium]